MGKVMRVCRVCGKEYEACHTRNISNVFRWQNVACSVECGHIYLERMLSQQQESSSSNTDADEIMDN